MGFEWLGPGFLGMALVHTFSVKPISVWARRASGRPTLSRLLHALSEVELVFFFWALLLVLAIGVAKGPLGALNFFGSLSFREPLFVLLIMSLAASRPIVVLAESVILKLSSLAPGARPWGEFFCILVIGPLLGSLITEPAAMTVTALVLKDRFFNKFHSRRACYLTLAVLFVNISIGGVLTHFAAPPVVMVAEKWNWTSRFMVAHFGWKALISIVLNTLVAMIWLRKELLTLKQESMRAREAWAGVPWWLILIHAGLLALVILLAHEAAVLLALLGGLLTVGWLIRGHRHHHPPDFAGGTRVGLFLSGLVVLGAPQSVWLEKAIHGLDQLQLFVGATILTAFNDNAAITYLGSQIPNFAESLRYVLLAGAVAGGGLTLIANAPNPIGYSILKEKFGEAGLNPLLFFGVSMIPTMVTMGCFWLLPNIG